MPPSNTQPQNNAPNQPIVPRPPILPNPPKQSKSTVGEEFKNTFLTALLFIFGPLFAILLIIFVFQSYVVDGSSMEPNLQNGNRVFILKLPKTIASIRGQSYIPDRDDVIVFKKPDEPNVQLIKRVIGLPGDHVIVKNNHITIFNDQHPNGYDPDQENEYTLLLEPSQGNVDIIVGPGELFVCGDNRSPGQSLDSRSGLGLVPVENIIGKLWIRYFPLSGFRLYSIVENIPITVSRAIY